MLTQPCPLDRLPPPREIHGYMGQLYRELALLRRLLRLAQAAQARERPVSPLAPEREVPKAG